MKNEMITNKGTILPKEAFLLRLAFASWRIQEHLLKTLAFICFMTAVSFSALVAQIPVVTVGSTTSLGNDCYQLTPAVNSQGGAIWSQAKMDLAANMTISGNLNFGTSDASGADGIAFVLQPVCNNVGGIGGGIGYAGLSPSLAVEFDDFQNPWDPSNDHVALMKDGVLDHTLPATNLQGPVIVANLEDGANHPFIIFWNATTQTLTVTLDAVVLITYADNIVANIFSGNNKVFWGFTASTGAANNNQSVCLLGVTVTQDPALVCPANIVTSSTTGACGANVSFSITPADVCSGATVVSSVPASGSFFPLGTTIVNAMGVNPNSPTSMCSFTVTVNGSPPAASISYLGSPLCTNAGVAAVTQTGTAGGTYTSTLGLSINATTGAITPSTSIPGTYTVTYTIPAGGGCLAVAATASVTITQLPVATISYAGSPFCTNSGVGAVTQTGNAGGTYTSTAGLSINAMTGAITPSTSTPGTYTVTYTIPAAAGCTSVAAIVPVTITQLPAATISYPGSPFCTNAGVASVTRTGAAGGTYTSTAGLSINATTGAITPSTSTPGTYTVNYTIPAAGGCPAVVATASVTITQLPVATISYAGSPFCTNAGVGAVSQTGNAGGTYASTGGLSINAMTGAITPSTSTPGTYTVTYTIPAAAGCTSVAATVPVTITQLPAATISYPGSPFCTNAGVASVTRTGAAGGTYTSTGGLSINATTGAITPSTSTPGSYTVTYTIPAAGGCLAVVATTPVTITLLPVASISYPGSPFCSSQASGGAVTQTGTIGGTYSSTAGLSINPTTGAINPTSSTPGTYTVTYTIPAAGGCTVVAPTTTVVVNSSPVASNVTVCYGGMGALTSTGCGIGTSAAGTLQWFTTPTGGTSIGSGSPFNPVGVAGSGLPNTTTPGTFTFYASCTGNSICRTAVNFVVLPAPPPLTITKTAGAIHYDQCVNPDEVIQDFTIRVENTTGQLLSNLTLDELITTVPGAYLGVVTYPIGFNTNANVVPQLNYSWNGTTNTSLFTNNSGVLDLGDFIEVSLKLRFNASLLSSSCIPNTTTVTGTYVGPSSLCPVSTVNSACVGGCAFPSSVPADLTVNACTSYNNEIQAWLAAYADAVIDHECRVVDIICNDYCEPHGWIYADNCSKNATLPVSFTVKYTDGSSFTYCANIIRVDPQVATFLTPPENLVLNCSGNNQAAQVQAWLNNNGGSIAQLCEGYIFHSNNYSGALPIGCNSSVPVTFTITNECGFSTSAVANINLIDNTPPLLSGLPANTTINCGDAIPAAPTVTATDACTPNVAVNLSEWVATISGNLSGANEVPANNSSASGRVLARLNGNNLQIVVAFTGLTVAATAAHIHEAAAGTNGPVRIDFVGIGFPVGATNGVYTTSVPLSAALQTALAAGNLYVNIHNPSFPGGEVRAQLREQCTNTTVRIWSASDACNNTVLAMRTVSATDTQAPTFTSVPASITVACDAATPAFGSATATDACSSVTITTNDVTTGTVCTGVSTTRTFTATDGCGNTATATQRVTKAADNAAPTFTFVPASTNFECTGSPTFGTATATDACSSVNVTFVNTNNGGSSCAGAIRKRTFTATDGCGNTATAVQTATPTDSNPPNFASVPAVLEIMCGDAVVFSSPSASDDCGTVTIHHQDAVSGDNCAGIMNIRIWTATDGCGNTSTQKQTVWQLGDHVDPEFTNQLEDEGVYFCGETPDYDAVGAEDNCGGSVDVSYEIDYDYEDHCHDGYGYYTKVRYTAVDACGNENHETITIHFVPEDHRMAFMYKPTDKTVSCNEVYTFDAVYPKVVSYDGAISSVTYTDIATLTPCGSGTITRRWTATDVIGNQAIAEQTVTILADTELPTLTLANSSAVIDCAAAIPVEQPTVSDNCTSTGEITLTYHDVNVENTLQRTWTAQDACGNLANATQIYIILDTQAPVFTSILQNKTINCGAPVLFDNATATDACSAVTMTFTDVQSALNCGAVYTRTWSAQDALGHVATVIQTITVVDNAAPVFTYVPVNQVVVSANLANFGTPQVADVCNNVQLTFADVQSAPNICGGYTMTRTWTATDACNNVAIAVQQIAVGSDTQAPIFSSTPVNQSVAYGQPVVFDALTASDNNSAATVTYTDVQSGLNACGGYTITRTWTATDACSNAAIAVQQIAVGSDTQAPIFSSIPVNQSVAFGTPVVFDALTASDNNSATTVTYSDVQSGQNACEGYTVTRTWTAIDACNNVAIAVQQIAVGSDTQAPIFTSTPVNQSVAFGTPVVFDALTATDNNGTATVTNVDVQSDPNICGGYTMTRTWTAIDGCNNEAIAVQQIAVGSDTQTPIFSSTPVNQSVAYGQPVVFDALTATDNNGTATVTYVDVQGTPACGNSGYTITRTWTAIDACYNQAVVDQQFTVGQDEESPSFSQTLLDKTIACSDLILFDTPAATDNSGAYVINYTDIQSSPSCGNSGYTITRTYTASDACNNAAQIAQTYTITEDTEAPVFVGSVFELEMTQAAFNAWVPIAQSAADNCQSVEVIVSTPIKVDDCNYTIDHTATDACGNFVIRTQNIHISDCLVLGTNEGELSSVGIYPNPVETELNITLSSEVNLKNVTAQVFDMLGKQVLIAQVIQHQSSINVSYLTAGTYTLRLTTNGGQKTHHFVKM